MTAAFTIGVEEEYQIIDPETRALSGISNSLIESNQQANTTQAVVHELYCCQVEIATRVCQTLDDVRQSIVQARKVVTAAAQKNGVAIAAAGTHPFSDWHDQAVTPKDRYYALQADLKRIIRELIIFGCHVHVGIEDREMAVQVVNRARIWLPTLLALTANSPFWLGEDTGYDCYRMEMWCRLPTAGPPPVFQDYADYQSFIQRLIDTGITDDPTKIYWDIRLSERYPTVEFRMADVCTTVDEAVMLAGLIRALARTCYQDACADQPFIPARAELLKAAMWQSARHGLQGDLIDFTTLQPVPAQDQVRSLLDSIKPALEHHGDWDVVSQQVNNILTHGNSAQRQRQIYQETGCYKAVVDYLIAQGAATLAVA